MVEVFCRNIQFSQNSRVTRIFSKYWIPRRSMENVKESCCFPIWSWLANFQSFNFCRDIAGITLFRCLCCNPTIVWAIKPFLLSLNITSTTKNLYTIFWSFNCSTLSFFSKRILWIVKKVEQKWNFVAIWVKMEPVYPSPPLWPKESKNAPVLFCNDS